MKPLVTTRFLLMSTVFAVFPYHLETDSDGKLTFVASLAQAKSGSGSDGDGGESGGDGDDGEGGGDGDDGEGGDDGDDGEGGDDGDDGEGGDDGDDGEGGDDGDDGEGGDDGDDGEAGDDGEDGEDGEDSDDEHGGERNAHRATKAQKVGNGARIFFSDGSREEIRDGQYVRIDPNGRVEERRRARSSDLARVRALIGGPGTKIETAPTDVKSRAVRATYRGNNIEILYANGWREEVSSGRYRLVDQYGRIVAARRATQKDRTRLNRFRK